MAITYPLTFPTTVDGASTTWGLTSAVGYLESDFTFQGQKQLQQGERWEVSVTLPRLTAAQAGDYRAFLAMLRGQYGTFLLGDFTRKTRLGAMTGSPLVNGASQSGNTLNIDGVSNSITNILKAGDWLQLGSGGASRLHMVVANCNSNGSGQVAVTIVPELRSSPADNSAVVYASPMGVFQLSKNDPAIFSTSGPDHSTISFNAVEVIA